MLNFAVLIGIYSYFVFLIGILKLLRYEIILFSSVTFAVLAVFLIIINCKKIQFRKFRFRLSPIELAIGILLLVLAIVNLIGALGPEISYDALWYHLTLPKLYLQKGQIYHISGNLLYYGAMPRLVEMLYVAPLALTNEIGAKVIHFLFGILTTLTIIFYGKRYFNLKVALIAALIFYSNLVVAWQSTTADIDLGRTFFEVLAFFFFLNWWKTRRDRELIKSGLLTGLALSTKYLAFGSIGILALLVFIFAKKQKILKPVIFILPAIFVALPWFVSSIVNTGNPIYPLFSGILSQWHNFVFRGFLNFFIDFFRLSNLPTDWVSPISPIYLILLPLTIFPLLKFPVVRVVGIYCFLAYVYWFLTPRTGGTRFILPYLPIFSLFVASIFAVNIKRLKIFQTVSLFAIIFLTFGHLAIRLYINAKNLPVILGKESKHEFLVNNLDFTNAFYDTDHYFERQIKSSDLVYIIGGQNLYYVNFPFTHESFGENVKYNYIFTQYKELPGNFGNAKLIYQNPKTYVKLYKLD